MSFHVLSVVHGFTVWQCIVKGHLVHVMTDHQPDVLLGVAFHQPGDLGSTVGFPYALKAQASSDFIEIAHTACGPLLRCVVHLQNHPM